jgi:phosphatidylserine decarboxylase
MRIRAPGGAEVIVVVPIAGMLARRMVCDVPVGHKLSIGGTYGLIWFGSRLDNYQPAAADPLVRIGQCAVAGETMLAELS